MNRRIQKQETDSAFQQMRAMLQSVSAPEVSDERLAAMGRKVFAELDRRQTKPWAGWMEAVGLSGLFDFCRSGAALAVAALAIAAIGVGVWSVLRTVGGADLSDARVVRIDGASCQSADAAAGADRVGVWEPMTLSSKIGRGRIFRTGEKSTLTVRLERGTGIQLLSNSVLHIVRADARGFSAFLEGGSVLVEVSPIGRRGRSFTIVTPNASCEIAGTIFKVDVFSRPEDSSVITGLTVIEGKIRFSERGGSGEYIVVESGKTALVRGRRLTEVKAADVEQEALVRLQTLGSVLRDETDGEQCAVQLTSEPAGASVFINDVWEGITPMTLVKSAGQYRVTMSYLNFQPLDTILEVAPGAMAQLRVVLSALPDGASASRIPLSRAAKRSAPRHRPDPTTGGAKRPVVQVERAAVESTPEFLEARAAMAAGRYAEAVAMLLTLKNRNNIVKGDLLAILSQLHVCYKNMANCTGIVGVLEEMYDVAGSNTVRKGNILWELATVKAECLKDYEGAEMDLVEYLVTQPSGVWRYEAYSRLAEIQYLLGKFKAAAKTYATIITTFHDEPDIDRAVYALAHVQRQDLDDCESAIRWYTVLLKDYPSSSYAEDAVFWRAECLLRLGRIKEARREYASYASRYANGRWKDVARERMAHSAP